MLIVQPHAIRSGLGARLLLWALALGSSAVRAQPSGADSIVRQGDGTRSSPKVERGGTDESRITPASTGSTVSKTKDPTTTKASAHPDLDPTTPPGNAAPATSKPSATDTFEERYRAAFIALAEGHRGRAKSLLQHALKLYPTHPLVAHLRTLLHALEQPAAPSRAAQAQAPTGNGGFSAQRAELIFFQTLHGIATGVEVCAIAACDGARPFILSSMVGGGAGLTLSFLLSTEGIDTGHARALTDGTWLGSLAGLGVLYTSKTNQGDDGDRYTAAHMALGQLAGLGLGHLAYELWQPSPGQVSLSVSGALWSMALTSQVLAILDTEFSSQEWAGTLLISGSAGLTTGGFLADHNPMSASRVLLVDLGGILGAVSGMGLGVLVSSEDRPDRHVTFSLGALGTMGGLGLAYYLMSGTDEGSGTNDGPSATARLGMVPLAGGGAMATLAGSW